MAEKVSIAERILRVVAVRAQNITGHGTIYRADARGRTVYADTSVIVQSDDEEPSDDAQGSWQLTKLVMPVAVGVVLLIDESGSVATDALIKMWQARIEWAIARTVPLPLVDATDNRLRETTAPNSYLADDMRVTSRHAWQPEKGRIDALVQWDVHYRTNRDDPYNGPGITELTE